MPSKRRLSFSDQRSQAPKLLSLWAIRREFYCIPRVKSLLRGVCHGIYLMLYIAMIFYAADRRRIERANLCLDQEALGHTCAVWPQLRVTLKMVSHVYPHRP